MNLTPVPSEGATCANCSAPLADDQRYCLSCGQPASPVRLAFLDVLQSEHQPQLGAAQLGTSTVAYSPLLDPAPTPLTWMRRYTPVFVVLGVLLLALIVGLLVGHWVTQSKAPDRQVVEVKGLTGAPVAATGAAATTSTTPTSTTPSATSGTSSKAEAAEVAKEAKKEKVDAAKIEKAVVVKPAATKLKSLGSSTGKKHEEEIATLEGQPIETGG